MPDNLPERVLFATDGSEDAALAGRAALDLCSKTGSELHVVHVRSYLPHYAYPGAITGQDTRLLEVDARRLLDDQADRIGSAGGTVAGAHLGSGRPDDEILGLAERLGVGLVVLGSRGLGRIKRLLLGSVAAGVVQRARCPVLVVRGGSEAWPPARLVLADDGSGAARKAGGLAAAIGELFGIEATLVRVYPELPEADEEGRRFDARMVDDELRRQQRFLEERARELEGVLGCRPRVRVTIAVGDAAEVIVNAARAETIMDAGQEEDLKRTLIAVGSRGLGLAQRLRLGSVSTKVLAAARGPVLVYPDPEERKA